MNDAKQSANLPNPPAKMSAADFTMQALQQQRDAANNQLALAVGEGNMLAVRCNELEKEIVRLKEENATLSQNRAQRRAK